MDFALFIVLNALLLLRPEDLFPGISGLRLYLVTITLCTAAALPKLSHALTPQALSRRPVAVCVLGMLAASFASDAYRGRVVEAFEFSAEFAKVALYFFLLLAVVDTPERLRAFVGWVVVFVCGSGGVALAHFHEVYEFAGLDPIRQRNDDPNSDVEFVERIVSAGVFNDPNDLCVILMTAALLALGMAVSSPGGLGRVLWLLPLGPLFYAGYLTHSRGGIIALMAGVAGTIYAAVGFRRSLPLTALAVPVVLMAGSSRGGNITSGGTAHERLMLWADNLTDLFRMPFHVPTGLGPGYSAAEHGNVCHNSYITAYVEHGLLGGGAFLGMFYFALRQTDATAGSGVDWVRRLRPFVFGAVAAYAAGCYSLTRNFTLPVYLMAGIGAAFAGLATPDTPARFLVDGRWWKWMAAASVAGLVLAKFSTQLLGHLGV